MKLVAASFATPPCHAAWRGQVPVIAPDSGTSDGDRGRGEPVRDGDRKTLQGAVVGLGAPGVITTLTLTFSQRFKLPQEKQC